MIALDLPIDIKTEDTIDMDVFKNKISEYALMLYHFMRIPQKKEVQISSNNKTELMKKFKIEKDTMDFIESLSLPVENSIPEDEDCKYACAKYKYNKEND